MMFIIFAMVENTLSAVYFVHLINNHLRFRDTLCALRSQVVDIFFLQLHLHFGHLCSITLSASTLGAKLMLCFHQAELIEIFLRR